MIAAKTARLNRDQAIRPSQVADQIAMIEERLSGNLQPQLFLDATNGHADHGPEIACLSLENRIIAAANEDSDVRALLAFAVEQICISTAWPFGNAYFTQGEAGEVHLAASGCAFAHFPVANVQDILAASDNNFVWPNAELPGKLLYDAVPCYQEIEGDMVIKSFGQRASELAIGGHFAVPIVADGMLVCAFEFFLGKGQKLDPSMAAAIKRVAQQVGHVYRRKSAEEALRHSALRDILTGLPNRTVFETSLKAAFDSKREQGESGPSLIYIDLDGFKLINDMMGHHVGDDLLVEVAFRLARLVAEFEATDRLLMHRNSRILLARIGGDEFSILVEGPDKERLAQDIALAVHEALMPPHKIDDQLVNIHASIGIAHDDGYYSFADELLRDADAAMYDAKAKSTCKTVEFDLAMRDNAVETLRIEADLRNAVRANELELHFQPIVRLEDEQPVGFEALLRWRRHGGDLIYPDTFITVAEEKGIISEIGNWALRNACNVLRELSIGRKSAEGLFMSVNVSTRQFLDPDFPNQVWDIIHDTLIDPSLLVLEVTESAAIINPSQTAQILERLRGWKIRIGLDDFGTGYSSLSHLQNLSFDAIKIDKSFVMSQSEEGANWSIVNAIMRLANAMNLSVVAEGIETRFQLEKLKTIGCFLGQGYLFSKPMSKQVMLTFLDNSA